MSSLLRYGKYDEDIDGDGNLDVHEDFNGNFILDTGDGYADPQDLYNDLLGSGADTTVAAYVGQSIGMQPQDIITSMIDSGVYEPGESVEEIAVTSFEMLLDTLIAGGIA